MTNIVQIVISDLKIVIVDISGSSEDFKIILFP